MQTLLRTSFMVLLPLVLLTGAKGQGKGVSINPGDSIVFAYPQDVKVIIDQKCFACHNANARSDMAKQKLSFDRLGQMTKTEQITRLNNIVEVLDNGMMPPKHYLEMKPEGKLTPEESKVLKNWAKSTADKMLN